MAGAIDFSDGRGWSVASWLFNVVVNYVAETVDDKELSEKLRLSIKSGVRYINVGKLETGTRAHCWTSLLTKSCPRWNRKS